jgi:hypothetical protein
MEEKNGFYQYVLIRFEGTLRDIREELNDYASNGFRVHSVVQATEGAEAVLILERWHEHKSETEGA